MCNSLISQSVSDGNSIHPERSASSYFRDPILGVVDEMADGIQSGRSIHGALDRIVELTRPLPRGGR